MAIKSDSKLTKFESASTVVTSDFANSIYGGLSGSIEGDLLPEDDAKNIGHAHDGLAADGHAQKVNLKDHVTSKLEHQNLEDEAVHVQNVWTSLDVADAIPEYIIGDDGRPWYYLDLSVIRDDFTFKETGYLPGDTDMPVGYSTADDLSLNPDPALGVSAVPLIQHGNENHTSSGLDFVFGSSSLDDMHGMGHSTADGDGDNRFLFDRSQAAFRAGSASGTHWDEPNRGAYSVSFGQDNVSTGAGSFSSGVQNESLADQSSVCGGHKNSIDGASSDSGILSGENQSIISSVASSICGGAQNAIGSSSQGSFLGAGTNNSIFKSPVSALSGGIANSITDSSASSIFGGTSNIMGVSGRPAHTSIIGGGISNQVLDINNSAIVGGVSNIVVGSYSAVPVIPTSGTIGSPPQSSFIGAGYGNHIELSDMAVISGGCENKIDIDGSFSAILGGEGNLIKDRYGAISGGFQNKIFDNSEYSVISGGYISEIKDSNIATIGGGKNNTIVEFSHGSTIGGGEDNWANDQSEYSTISGGKGNKIAFSSGAHISGGFNSEVISANFASASGDGAHSFMHGQSSRSSAPFSPFPGGSQYIDTEGGRGSAQASSVILSGRWGYGSSTPGLLGSHQYYALALDGFGGANTIFVGLGTSMSFKLRGIMTGYDWSVGGQESVSFEVAGVFLKRVSPGGGPGNLAAMFGQVASIASRPGLSMDTSADPTIAVIGDVKIGITSSSAVLGIGPLNPLDNKIRFDITENQTTNFQWTSTVVEIELVENRFYWDGTP